MRRTARPRQRTGTKEAPRRSLAVHLQGTCAIVGDSSSLVQERDALSVCQPPALGPGSHAGAALSGPMRAPTTTALRRGSRRHAVAQPMLHSPPYCGGGAQTPTVGKRVHIVLVHTVGKGSHGKLKQVIAQWSVFLSFCLSVSLSLCLSASLPLCLSVSLSLLSISPPLHLSTSPHRSHLAMNSAGRCHARRARPARTHKHHRHRLLR